MKTIMKFSIVIFAFALILVSCGFGWSTIHIVGKGDVVTEKRVISKFSKISCSASVDIKFTQSEATSLEIHAQKNILELLETYVENDELVIEFKDNTWFSNSKPIEIVISNATLESLSFSGSGSFVAEKNVKSPAMEISVSGSTEIIFGSLEAGSIESQISGSGNIAIGGSNSCQKLDLQISGSGKYAAKKLRVDNVEVSISGSGSCKVNAVSRLQAHVSGSGHVYYNGNPVIDSEVSGSGQVQKLEE